MAKNKKSFDGLFADLQDITDAKGKFLNTVLFSKRGDCSVIFEIENPVQQYCTDADQYYAYMDVLNSIVQMLGEGYAMQKQDIFSSQLYHHDITPDMNYMMKRYFQFFEGRPYTEIRTFIIITQEAEHGFNTKFDPKKWEDFHVKVAKVEAIFHDRYIPAKNLNKREIDEYLHRFMAFDFKHGPFSMDNMKASDEYMKMGSDAMKSFSLVDVDEINLPTWIKPYNALNINGYPIATDLLAFLPDIPNIKCVVYNQVIQIPKQRQLIQKMLGKAKRHDSMPDTSNKIAAADIRAVVEKLETETKLMVHTNFNLLVRCPLNKMTEVTSFLETKLYNCGITPSKSAYNQLELFQCSFPGNAFTFNPSYDLFLTLSDAALCLCYKEHIKHSEDTKLKIYYTDRYGLPLAIDITGKEGAIKYTDNANFFCIGPSGSGKSFNMNNIVAQLLLQGTDVVMVDTGDSYEGTCHTFHGTYITYSKEHPISMNPFKMTALEYNENFSEKKDFLKSMIFLIFKGNVAPTKLEDIIIDQTIDEYYDAYFHPFKKFSEEERQDLRKELLLVDKMNGKYEEFQQKIEEKYSDTYDIPELDKFAREDNKPQTKEEQEKAEAEKERRAKLQRRADKLHSLVNDPAATEGEKENAKRQLMLITPELIENQYLVKIEKRIDDMERQKQKMKVSSLSFNTYYEFVVERIPQIMRESGTAFNIREFAKILKTFYRGGALEYTLNNDVDAGLFDEKFIVFEIDKIKDNKTLFPIVVLIIMDVFLQKMRLKKGRKALIIEEAWKAISTPAMAEYIKYLYKTVRKFNGIAGVVTQELNDVIDSPIVKEAIINNSDVKILLDQSKFKDRYDDIAAILGLTPVQRQQIFTINSLDNHEGRNYFKEVWICRGQYSDVFGAEVPPEWYWAFTTERVEKEALKIYERAFDDDIFKAIDQIETDRKKSGAGYLEFARRVNNHQKIMKLWENGKSY